MSVITTPNTYGLRKHPNYEDLMEYLDKEPKIKYPERPATFARQTPQFQNMIQTLKDDLTEYQQRQLKNNILEDQYRQIAEETGHSVDLIRAQNRNRQAPDTESGMSDTSGETIARIEEAEREQEERSRSKIRRTAEEVEQAQGSAKRFLESIYGKFPPSTPAQYNISTPPMRPSAPPITPGKSPEFGTPMSESKQPTKEKQAMRSSMSTMSTAVPSSSPGQPSRVQIRNQKPVIPDNWWQTLSQENKAKYDSYLKSLEGKTLDELKGIYRNNSGSSAHHNVGVKTLMKYIAYIKMVNE